MLPSVSADSSVYPSLPTWQSEESVMSSMFACHDVHVYEACGATGHQACCLSTRADSSYLSHAHKAGNECG